MCQSSFNIWFHEHSLGHCDCCSFSQAADLQTWTDEVPGAINIPTSTPPLRNQVKSAAFLRRQEKSPDSSKCRVQANLVGRPLTLSIIIKNIWGEKKWKIKSSKASLLLFKSYWRTACPRRSRSRPGTRAPAATSWSPWRWAGSRRRTRRGAAAAGGSRPFGSWTWRRTRTRWCTPSPPAPSWWPLRGREGSLYYSFSGGSLFFTYCLTT